ncbi:MAG: sugar ABC transporter permease [Aggregatilineales bacterium]
MNALTDKKSIRTTAQGNPGVLERLLAGPWMFILPGVLLYGAFALYPVIYQFWVATTNMATTSISRAEFIGFHNFEVIAADPVFRNSFIFTIAFVLVTVPVQFVLGFGLALFLDQKLPGRLFFRLSIIIPLAISSIIVGLMWRLLLHESNVGFVNAFLGTLGMDPVPWFSQAMHARFSLFIVNIWHAVGTTMIFMLGGLQTLDQEVLEAAEVDGATGWQRIIYVKLPMLRTIAGLAIVLIFAGTFQIFEKVLALTNGGPARATSTIGFEMYTTAFPESGTGQLGMGAAMGLVMFAFILIITIFYVWMVIFEQED